MNLTGSQIKAESTQVSIAADRYNCYPGERLKFFIRFIGPALPGAEIQVHLPHVLKIEGYELPAGIPPSSLFLIEGNQEITISLKLEDFSSPGVAHDLTILTSISTFFRDQYLLCEVNLSDSEGALLSSEEIQIAVVNRSKYLEHLPEIYEQDDFINRFLMLVESFWKPTNQQIDFVSNYFDPLLTPREFLPWLASWMGMPVDEFMPEDRKRRLVQSAMFYFQQRGTKAALQDYLQVYTNGEVEIIEKRARNFVIGKEGRLGVEVALGKQNKANMVLVRIKVPREELERLALSEKMYRMKLEETVRNFIPASAYYEVDYEFIQ